MVEDQPSKDWLVLKSAAEEANTKADFETADKLWTIALQESERSGSLRHMIDSLHALSDIKVKLNNPVTAEQLLKRALNELGRKFGPDHQEVAAELDVIGGFYYSHQKYEKCEHYLKQSLAIYNKTLSPDDMKIGEVAYRLALVMHGLQKFSEAEPMYRRAIAIKRAHLGETSPEVLNVMQDFQALLQTPRLGQLAEQVVTGQLPIVKSVNPKSGATKVLRPQSNTKLRLRSLFSPGKEEEK